ncbi:MAG: Sua5 family C-terminal domain-containing protein, partial [Paenisporosarcina sp.]
VIGEVIEPLSELEHDQSIPKAPGMKYAHYAPDAPVYLIKPEPSVIMSAVREIHKKGQTVALLAPDSCNDASADWFFSLGDETSLDGFAHSLYAHLRACDETTADIVLVTVPHTEGVGTAILNRLEKAANGNWWIS